MGASPPKTDLPALRFRLEREERDLAALDLKADGLRRALEEARAETEAALVRIGAATEAGYNTCSLGPNNEGRLSYFAGASLVFVPAVSRQIGDLCVAATQARANEREALERFEAVAEAYATTAEALEDLRDLERELTEEKP